MRTPDAITTEGGEPAGPQPVEHPAEDVAAHLVGAEQEWPPWSGGKASGRRGRSGCRGRSAAPANATSMTSEQQPDWSDRSRTATTFDGPPIAAGPGAGPHRERTRSATAIRPQRSPRARSMAASMTPVAGRRQATDRVPICTSETSGVAHGVDGHRDTGVEGAARRGLQRAGRLALERTGAACRRRARRRAGPGVGVRRRGRRSRPTGPPPRCARGT